MRGVATWAVGLWLASVACVAAWAQGTTPSPTAHPEYHALFKRTYADPTNLDLAFQFAELATKLGDYEAAIGALERLLFYNPNLTKVRLQLGALYFKLGAYPMARTHFEQVAATPGAAPELQGEANRFMAEMDRRMSPHKFSVYAQTGLRYQSNANVGPNGVLIRSLSQDAVLNSQFQQRPDWNWFATVAVNYAYDPQWGNGITFETGFLGYYSKQFTLSQYDLGLFDAHAGPRFQLPVAGASIRPYAIGTISTLDSALYFSGVGIGTSAVFDLGFARFEPYVEYRPRSFHGVPAFPTSWQQSGTLTTVAAVADGGLFGPVRWFARGGFDRNHISNFALAFNAYDRWWLDAGLPVAVGEMLGWSRQLVVTPIVGISRADYDAPNPAIDATLVRADRGWQVGVLIDAQIYQQFGLRGQVSYARNSSNLPNFAYDNLSFVFGPTVRF